MSTKFECGGTVLQRNSDHKSSSRSFNGLCSDGIGRRWSFCRSTGMMARRKQVRVIFFDQRF